MSARAALAVAPGAVEGHTFPSVGTYAYRCAEHAGLAGEIAIRMASNERSHGRAWTIRWAMGHAAPGQDYDVQVGRRTATGWHRFVKDVDFSSSGFQPRRRGTYKIRARTSNPDQGVSSGWSPVMTVRVVS